MKLFGKVEFYVSPAQIDDYPFLAKIHGQGFDSAWNEDELVSSVAAKGTSCLVANIRGKGNKGPKGFLLLRALAGQSEILTLAIDREYRRRGMARALMGHAIRQLQAERIAQLFLEVSESNVAALNLYRSLKFKQISRRKSYYKSRSVRSDGVEEPAANALVMQLELR